MNNNTLWVLSNCRFARTAFDSFDEVEPTAPLQTGLTPPLQGVHPMHNHMEDSNKIDHFAKKVAYFLKQFHVDHVTTDDISRATTALGPDYLEIIALCKERNISFAELVNDYLTLK